MREIKFRVWDKEYKEIYEVLELDFELKRAFVDTGGNVCVYIKFDEIELMQYTGNTDENNIEICDGDIISITHQYMAGGVYQEDRWTGVIKFNGLEFVLRNYKIKNMIKRPKTLGDDILCNWVEDEYNDIPLSYFDVGEIENSEIIGNIYENPELLESD